MISKQILNKRGAKIINNLFYDGFNSKLIETANFESFLELPILEPQKEKIIPKVALPFSKRKYLTDSKSEMLVFYEKDPIFRDFVSIPQNYIDDLKDVYIFSTPDCSLYRDMPIWEQIANIGVAHSVAYYLQQHEKYIIPNVRWGSKETYTNDLFGFAPAFAGIPKHSVVSIGTYGCCKTKEDKYYVESGLDAMLMELEPSDVTVYGSSNPKIFDKYTHYTNFHHLPDWISHKKGGH